VIRLPLSPQQIQSRLLKLTAGFLFFYSCILTLAPAARSRSWSTGLAWSHWLGFAFWAAAVTFAFLQLRRHLPDSDPYLLPIAALLSGWGILTIWRLDPGFGFRQALWLVVSVAVFFAGLHLAPELRALRRYKYVWLSSGLLLTALTLIFGTNPTGGVERLWLGCCGVYFQPSEPLKLLLIVYLAAYLADHLPLNVRLVPLLFPITLITAIASLLLLAQHDLGTVFIFIYLFTITLFVASGKRRVLWISLGSLIIAGLAGYYLFDVVRLRMDAWLNPWLDPSGRSYQIVQSLLAIANGGIFGRGPGMGSPGLVPVAISDFVYAAITEETGLMGAIALLALIGLFVARGMRITLRAPDQYRRFLAAGLTAYVGAQSILIVGGNIRLLPLTGVTLPFISYGGSSLLTSFIALLLLLLISSQPQEEAAPLPNPGSYSFLTGFLCLGLFSAALTTGWWAVWRGPDLLLRTDNARRSIADRFVKRGSLLDRQESPITITIGESGSYQRQYLYPDLGPVVGYTNPAFGQAGLESSLDPYLRGLQGNPTSLIWLDHLLYGQPPPGLDVRLSLDLHLQRIADTQLGSYAGAIVLLNAQTGEILAMASHPTFDPNLLNQEGPALAKDVHTPLLDRPAQGMYPPGSVLALFTQAAGLGANPDPDRTAALYAVLGFYTSPAVRLPVAAASLPTQPLRLSPLQMALAGATLSHEGIRPAPRLVMAVKTPLQGWVVLPALSQSVTALPASAAAATASALAAPGQMDWGMTGSGSESHQTITWYLGGTLPDWQGTPLALVVTLEANDAPFAEAAGQAILNAALHP
jgi:cell division protein FtsW (lipid II flippase)